MTRLGDRAFLSAPACYRLIAGLFNPQKSYRLPPRRRYLKEKQTLPHEQPKVSMKAKLSLPPVDLAGLNLPMEAWTTLKCFYEMTNLEDELGKDYTMGDLLGLMIRNWSGLQGAAVRMQQAERDFVAEWNANDKAQRDRERRRIRKAKRAARSLPANVSPIDSSAKFCPE